MDATAELDAVQASVHYQIIGKCFRKQLATGLGHDFTEDYARDDGVARKVPLAEPRVFRNAVAGYLSLAVLVSIILLILVLHQYVWTTLTQYGVHQPQKSVSPMLINPAFLGLILTALSIGDYYWAQWISRRFKARDRSITFFSERRSVTLPLADILYIESNDTEVRIVTASGESYRNKTGISQWENLLGEGFLRIHRSYLVRTDAATLTSADTVSVGKTQLPVSRKYRDRVQKLRTEFPSGSSTSTCR